MFKPFYVKKRNSADADTQVVVAIVNRHFYLADYSGQFVKYLEKMFFQKFVHFQFVDNVVMPVLFLVTKIGTCEAYRVFAIEDGLFYLVQQCSEEKKMMSIVGDNLCSSFKFVMFDVES